MNLENRTRPIRTSFLILIAIFTNVLGNFFLGQGMRQIGEMVCFSPLPYLGCLLNPWVAGGVALLAVWMISQLSLLSRLDLSYILPLTSIAYVLTAILGRVFLSEQVSLMRWAGIVIISFGVLLVSETAPRTIASPAGVKQ